MIQSFQHHHHFLTEAQASWFHGAVKVVNWAVLRLMRTLISQYRMATKKWVSNTANVAINTQANPTTLEVERNSVPSVPITSATVEETRIENVDELNKLSMVL